MFKCVAQKKSIPMFYLTLHVFDALTNTYLGLRKSKDGDKAEHITIIILISFLKWGKNLLKKA